MRLFRGLLLCWCKYTKFRGEMQMLFNFRLHFGRFPACGKLLAQGAKKEPGN